MQARRVVAMAASHDLHVVPHGSSVYSYHLQYAFPNCPLAEFINLSPQVGVWRCTCDHSTSSCVYSRGPQLLVLTATIPQGEEVVPYFGDLFSDEPLPSAGYIDLPPRSVHATAVFCPRGNLDLCIGLGSE